MICEKCGKPKTFNLHGADVPIACDCTKKQEEQYQIEGRRRIYKHLKNNLGINDREKNATFERAALVPGQENAINKAKQWCNDYLSGKAKNGLLFCGQVGAGKSYIACAILDMLCKNQAICVGENVARAAAIRGDVSHVPLLYKFVRAVDIPDIIISGFEDENSERRADSLKTARVLVMDDFGAERDTDFVREKLYAIIDHRHGNNLPMTITTNLSIKELSEKYGARIFDRLKEACQVIGLTSCSQRQPAGKASAELLKTQTKKAQTQI